MGAAAILSYVASELATAAATLNTAIANEDSAAAVAALRAVEHAGAVADRAAAALGAGRVQDDDEWRYGPRVREALAAVEREVRHE
jgi:hypothetical protein